MANQSHGIGCTFQLGFGGSAAGVFISKVQEGGPAAAVGVQYGDRSSKPPYPNLNLDSSYIIWTQVARLFPRLKGQLVFFSSFLCRLLSRT